MAKQQHLVSFSCISRLLQSKAKKGIATTSNMTKSKAGKKKQPDPVYSEMEGTTEDEEEPSLRDLMSNKGNMLSNLTTRMES